MVYCMSLFSLNISNNFLISNGNVLNSSDTLHNTNTSNISTFGTEIISDDNPNKEPSEMELIAREKGYKSTEIPIYFYDEKKDKYLKWDAEKNKFVKAGKPQLVLPNGNYIDAEGTYKKVTSNVPYKEKTIAYMDGKNLTAIGVGAQINAHYAFADFYGYKKTAKENIYIKETAVKTENGTETKKEYVTWNYKTDKFETSNITEVLSNGYYTRNGKYYSDFGDGLSKEEYEAGRYGLRKDKDGLYKTRGYIPELAEGDNVLKKIFEEYINPSDPFSGMTEYKWNEKEQTFELTGKVKLLRDTVADKADGTISGFQQGSIGDCWLLSSVSGIANSPEGEKELKDIIQTDENGNITINLKGVNKTYTFSDEDINNAIKENRFSLGDKDVIAIEMAFEKFRRELIDTGKGNLRDKNSVNYIGGSGINQNEGYELHGGFPSNAISVLTDKKSTTYSIGNFENTIRINYGNNQNGKLDEKLLNKYLNNPDNIIIPSLDEPGEDDHAYRLDSIKDGNVLLYDPHDTSKLTEMSIEEFYQRLHHITITNLSEDI